MTDPQPPRIEFPCDYPIKVMGENLDDFESFVVEVVERHAPDFDRSQVTIRTSRGDRYLAVTVIIRARGEEQIAALFSELKASGRVRLVL